MVTQEVVDPVECGVVRIGGGLVDAADQREEILPERARLRASALVFDLLEVCGFDVLPPSLPREVRRECADDEAVHRRRRGAFVFLLLIPVRVRFASVIRIRVLHEKEHELGVEAPGPATDVDAPEVGPRGSGVLGERGAVVVDGDVGAAEVILQNEEANLVDGRRRTEEEREDVEFEEPGIEGERREHGSTHRAALDRFAQRITEDGLRDSAAHGETFVTQTSRAGRSRPSGSRGSR